MINGEEYDFSQLPEGYILPRLAVKCDWLVSDVKRIDGAIHLTILLPHGADAPEITRFPSPIINPPDGVIDLPPYNAGDEQ